LGRWLVALTFLLAALLPTLSQALAVARGDVVAWSQICRSAVVSPRAAQSLLAERAVQKQDSAHGLFEHCPFCALHATDLAAPPPAAQAPLLLSGLSFGMPARFYSSPHSVHAWTPAQSRAPPVDRLNRFAKLDAA
jgi:hypothetical protein